MLLQVREMRIRVAQRDALKATVNRHVAATFTFAATTTTPAYSKQYVGAVQAIINVPIGNHVRTMLSVLWYRNTKPDDVLPHALNVKVSGGADAALFEADHLIEAVRIDASVWLTDLPGSQHWKRVHFKYGAAHVVPEHRLPANMV
jgi:hypothetical protein